MMMLRNSTYTPETPEPDPKPNIHVVNFVNRTHAELSALSKDNEGSRSELESHVNMVVVG